MSYRAVVFDLGGVVFPSPLDAFRAYETRLGLPERFLSRVVLADPDRGAWSRLERGELDLEEFASAFEAECVAAGAEVDALELMTGVAAGMEPRPAMVAAIGAIRAHGFTTAALTNNWTSTPRAAEGGDGEGSAGEEPGPLEALQSLFDLVVESAVVGMRKPDPRIYALVCERAGVQPAEAVFLDDLGANLKPARAMGMTTIKVVEPSEALAELGEILGIRLGHEEVGGAAGTPS